MESNFDARNALSAVATDRERLGARVTAETYWAAPAQGLGAALLIGSPAAGMPGMFLAMFASIAIFLGVEWVFRQRSGLSISRPAGPGGTVLLVVLAVLLAGLTTLCFTLFAFDLRAWIVPVALVGGLLSALGVVAYDRTFSHEVRRAR